MKHLICFVLCCWWLTGCSQLSWSHNETLPTPTTHNGVVDEQYYQELVAYNAYVDAQLTYVATVLQKVPKPEPAVATVSAGCTDVFVLPEQTPAPRVPVVDPDNPDAVADALALYITQLRSHRKDYQRRLDDSYNEYRQRCMSKKT